MLTGCSLGGTASIQGAETAGDPANRFVACLSNHNVVAAINDFSRDDDMYGAVMIHDPDGELSRQYPPVDSTLRMSFPPGAQLPAGTWLVLNSPSGLVGDLYDAYTYCEGLVPEFVQPQHDVTAAIEEISRVQARRLEDGVLFAQCARDEGFSSIPDPELSFVAGTNVPTTPAVDLLGLSMTEIRNILEMCAPTVTNLNEGGACWDTDFGTFCGSIPEDSILEKMTLGSE